MSLESDVQTLRRVPLFVMFTDDQLRLLAFSAETRRISAGSVLFTEGERADSAFVVVSGAIQLTRSRKEDGSAKTVDCLAGDLLCETALVVETTHLTSAIATTDVKYIQLRRPIFMRVLEEYPDAAARLREIYAHRLLETSSALEKVRTRLTALD